MSGRRALRVTRAACAVPTAAGRSRRVGLYHCSQRAMLQQSRAGVYANTACRCAALARGHPPGREEHKEQLVLAARLLVLASAADRGFSFSMERTGCPSVWHAASLKPHLRDHRVLPEDVGCRSAQGRLVLQQGHCHLDIRSSHALTLAAGLAGLQEASLRTQSKRHIQVALYDTAWADTQKACTQHCCHKLQQACSSLQQLTQRITLGCTALGLMRLRSHAP